MTQALSVRKAGFWQAIIVILANQLPMLAIVALMPALPTLKEHFAGMPNADLLVPMILTAPGLCIAFIAPFSGFLVDKFGRRNLLIVFLALYGIGGVLPFFLDGFNTVITGRLLLGAGEAFVLVIGNALLGDYFAPKERAKWLMYQGFFGSVAASIFLAISGRLANIGWNYPFLVYGIALVISALAYFFIFEPTIIAKKQESKPTESSEKFPLKMVIILFVVTLFTAIIYFVYTINFALALDAMGIKDKIKLGNMSAVASFGVPVGALVFRLVSKRPFWQQLALIFLLFSIGLSGIGLTKDANFAMVIAFAQQIGCGMTIPVLVTWGLNMLPEEYRGRGMGFWTSGLFLGMFVSPMFVSLVSRNSGGLLAAFLNIGILCFVIMLVLVVYNTFLSNSKLEKSIV